MNNNSSSWANAVLVEGWVDSPHGFYTLLEILWNRKDTTSNGTFIFSDIYYVSFEDSSESPRGLGCVTVHVGHFLMCLSGDAQHLFNVLLQNFHLVGLNFKYIGHWAVSGSD